MNISINHVKVFHMLLLCSSWIWFTCSSLLVKAWLTYNRPLFADIKFFSFFQYDLSLRCLCLCMWESAGSSVLAFLFTWVSNFAHWQVPTSSLSVRKWEFFANFAMVGCDSRLLHANNSKKIGIIYIILIRATVTVPLSVWFWWP